MVRTGAPKKYELTVGFCGVACSSYSQMSHVLNFGPGGHGEHQYSYAMS